MSQIPKNYFLISEQNHYGALAIIKTACDALEESLDAGNPRVSTLRTGITMLERDTIEPMELPDSAEQGEWTDLEPVQHNEQVPATFRQRTARLTDAADETEAGIRELLAALDMAILGDTDAETGRYAVRAFAKLARSPHERARDAARMAEELHESNGGPDS